MNETIILCFAIIYLIMSIFAINLVIDTYKMNKLAKEKILELEYMEEELRFKYNLNKERSK